MLLIIAHGGIYLTLYGHAEVLYKSVGDSVAPGDVIAAMSDAGGAAPQLYFEIREGARPVDPKEWLKPASERSARDDPPGGGARPHVCWPADDHENAEMSRSWRWAYRSASRSDWRWRRGGRIADAERHGPECAVAGCAPPGRSSRARRAGICRSGRRSSTAASRHPRHGVLARPLLGVSGRRRIRRHQDLELGRVLRRRHRGVDGRRAGRGRGPARRLPRRRRGNSRGRRHRDHRRGAGQYHDAGGYHRAHARQGGYLGQSRHPA